MTVDVAALSRVTVNARFDVPLLPSDFDALPIDTFGATTATSSLVIVPVAVAVPSVAPEGADSVTVNVSSCSTVVSPVTAMLMVLEVSPAAKVTRAGGARVILSCGGGSVGRRVVDRHRAGGRLRQRDRERHVRRPRIALGLRRIADRDRRGDHGHIVIGDRAVAVAVPKTAFVGADNVTVNVSSGSTVASPAIATLMVLDVSPAAKVTVPEVDV